METLEIESTERTPGIKFDYDHHYFEINGEAYPENSDEFFRPIMESLQEYSGLGSSAYTTISTSFGNCSAIDSIPFLPYCSQQPGLYDVITLIFIYSLI